MNALAVGPGARAALAVGETGSVVASFSRACYVRLAGGLLALVGPEAHPGPLHVVLDASPHPVEVGSRATVSEGLLGLGDDVVWLSSAIPWNGALPSPPEVVAAARGAADLMGAAAARSALAQPDLAARAREARDRLRKGNLLSAASLLWGVGPGLTPAGDDVLAGALFALRAAHGPACEETLVAAAEGPTSDLSLAFLAWAARGQALAPAHDLLTASADGDRAAAVAAGRALAAVGHTSGADFALGLRWGLSIVAEGPCAKTPIGVRTAPGARSAPGAQDGRAPAARRAATAP